MPGEELIVQKYIWNVVGSEYAPENSSVQYTVNLKILFFEY